MLKKCGPSNVAVSTCKLNAYAHKDKLELTFKQVLSLYTLSVIYNLGLSYTLSDESYFLSFL